MRPDSNDQDIPSDQTVAELHAVGRSRQRFLTVAQDQLRVFPVFVNDFLCVGGNLLCGPLFHLAEDLQV